MWSEPGGVPNPSSLCCRLPATTSVSNYARGMQQMRHCCCHLLSEESKPEPAPPWSHKALGLLLSAPAALLSPLLPHITGTRRPLPVALKILISPRSGGFLRLPQRSAVVSVPPGATATCLPAQNRCLLNREASSSHL